MTYFKKVGLVIWPIVLTLILPTGVLADEFKLVPSIAVREEYNDNIFFDDQGEVDDWITTISPGLELIEKTERLDLNLSARGHAIKYGQNDELNDFDQDYSGNIGYRVTSRLKVSAGGGYTVDNRRDRDIETTGLVLSTEERKRYNGSVSGSYVFTEKTAAFLSYAYEKDDFDDPEEVDYKYHSSNLGVTHDLSEFFPRTVGRMNFGYSYYDSSDTEIDTYSGTMGFSWAITEVFNLLIDLGTRYTRSEFTAFQRHPLFPFIFITREEKDYSWGGVGHVALSYQGEVTLASLSASKDVRPAGGQNGTTDRTSLLFKVNRRFAEKFSAHLSGEYFLNKADAGELSRTDIDEQTISIRPGLSCEILDNLVLTASYTYTRLKDREDHTDPERNLIYVQMRYGMPLFD
jgi:hypothetical protein